MTLIKNNSKSEQNPQGATVKTITTTTVEEFSDGSSSTKTSIRTITEGASINQVDPATGKPSGKSYNPSEAKASAPRVIFLRMLHVNIKTLPSVLHKYNFSNNM